MIGQPLDRPRQRRWPDVARRQRGNAPLVDAVLLPVSSAAREPARLVAAIERVVASIDIFSEFKLEALKILGRISSLLSRHQEGRVSDRHTPRDCP